MTQKHDFKGIKKVGATVLLGVIASSPFSFLATGFLGRVTTFFLEKIVNVLANKGLIILNVGAMHFKTEAEAKAYVAGMELALKKVSESEGRLTPEQVKEIDDEVIKVFDDFAILV